MKTAVRNALALSLVTALAASPAYASCAGDVGWEAAKGGGKAAAGACLVVGAISALVTVVASTATAAAAAPTLPIMLAVAPKTGATVWVTVSKLCAASIPAVSIVTGLGAVTGGIQGYNNSPDCSPRR